MAGSLGHVKKVRAQQLPESFPGTRQERLDRLGRATFAVRYLAHGTSIDVLFKKHLSVVIIQSEQGRSDDGGAFEALELLGRRQRRILDLNRPLCYRFERYRECGAIVA
jgi:hypothetical protein